MLKKELNVNIVLSGVTAFNTFFIKKCIMINTIECTERCEVLIWLVFLLKIFQVTHCLKGIKHVLQLKLVMKEIAKSITHYAKQWWVGLLIVFAIALFLRLIGLDWDAGHYLHPDERFLAMVGRVAFQKVDGVVRDRRRDVEVRPLLHRR